MFFPYPTEEILYKRIHCLKHGIEIRLCPNVEGKFTRADSKIWDIQTNTSGERIVSTSNKEGIPTKVWLLGDSMAMGYGLESKKTIAYQLEHKFNILVRVIAVDAIGTNGISSFFNESYLETKKENLPTHIYWIWNPSDFIDDEREKKGISKFLYPIHFYLSRISILYYKLLPSSQTNVYSNEIPYHYPITHKTYLNLKEFLKQIPRNKEHWKILFSWGMAKNGTPDTMDSNYETAKQFFESQNLGTIDLRLRTEKLFGQNKKIYIPDDGHPDEDLAEIFAEAIAADYKKYK
ncbi:hypothetical protein AB3N60_12100 [Leptospira sp. WS39.C2]